MSTLDYVTIVLFYIYLSIYVIDVVKIAFVIFKNWTSLSFSNSPKFVTDDISVLLIEVGIKSCNDFIYMFFVALMVNC